MTSSIISPGRRNQLMSAEYVARVEKVRTEIENKYRPLIERKNNFFAQKILTLKKFIELRREIQKIASLENLYVRNK